MVTADFNTWEAQTGATSDDALGHTCDYSFSICIHSSIFSVVHVFSSFLIRGTAVTRHSNCQPHPDATDPQWVQE